MVFWPFYVQKEFLRKIPSLPDFDFRDSDNTQTVILENIIRSSSTFFISGGYLRTVVPRNHTAAFVGAFVDARSKMTRRIKLATYQPTDGKSFTRGRYLSLNNV